MNFCPLVVPVWQARIDIIELAGQGHCKVDDAFVGDSRRGLALDTGRGLVSLGLLGEEGSWSDRAFDIGGLDNFIICSKLTFGLLIGQDILTNPFSPYKHVCGAISGSCSRCDRI